MLKKIRIAIALVFFIGITLLFVGIGQQWWGWMAKLQFLPSCLALNFAVIAGVIALTLVFGRIYCSVICPMGVFQDIVMWLRRRGGLLLNKIQAKKIKKAKAENKQIPVLKPYVKHFGFVKEKKVVRYTVLALTLVAIFAGIQFFVALIAPYSAYGRIVRTFAGIAEGQSIVPDMLFVAFITLIVIFICAWLWGRAWCNTICPVGTTLGLFSRFALFRPVIETEKCNACGRCYRGCKSSCIDGEHHKIDYSRCVDCFDCIGRCKGNAIHYKFVGFGGPKANAGKKAAETTQDNGRRAFLATSVFALTALASEAGSGRLIAAPAMQKAPERSRIVPFGAGSEKNFYDHCTACQLCVSNCKGGVLRASGDLQHFLQPQLDYSNGYCRPDCNNCSTLCPAGAILPVTLEEKHGIRIGVAKVDTDTCAGCGKCSRKCPEGAIEMVSGRPVVDTMKCIGCGACEYICPVRPVKAIRVGGLSIHTRKS